MYKLHVTILQSPFHRRKFESIQTRITKVNTCVDTNALRQRGVLAAEVGVAAAEAYLAGLTIANEGADWVLTISEISEGNYAAALAFAPFISAAAVRHGGRMLIRVGNETIELSAAALDALRAAKGKKTFKARWDAISAVTELTAAQRRLLVRAGYIKHLRHNKLRQNLVDAGGVPSTFTKAEAHHDLAWKYRQNFAEVGLDVNAPAHGRWVEGGRGTQHATNSAAFNQEWQTFFDGFPNKDWTKDDCLNFMNGLRQDDRFQFVD